MKENDISKDLALATIDCLAKCQITTIPVAQMNAIAQQFNYVLLEMNKIAYPEKFQEPTKQPSSPANGKK